MSTVVSDLLEIVDRLENVVAKGSSVEFVSPLDSLENEAKKVGKAWSGSWLGYHAQVYYKNLQPPPPGAHFSPEWGLMPASFVHETRGEWQEFDNDFVRNSIYANANNPDLSSPSKLAQEARDKFEESRAEIISLLTTVLMEKDDSFISRLKDQAENAKSVFVADILDYLRPKQAVSRDMTALHHGMHSPPHIVVTAEVSAIKQTFQSCLTLEKIARQAASHLSKRDRYSRRNQEIGTNVFIGHGRSPLWRELKDFIQDRVELPWDEFNRIPVAGITNIARLSEMLNDAAIAFLVMTAEDEQTDGKMHARMNVIHEAGLFQGRLGFTKAIVLLEEGCEEFSNIHGLGQIRFPKGNIKAAFEEIRQVLEREDLISDR